MKIDSEVYRGFDIVITQHKQTWQTTATPNSTMERKYFHASSIVGTSWGYCETPNDAAKQVKEQIDELFGATPNNYTELAEQITKSLMWYGYDEKGDVDPKILEILVESFLKNRNNGK